MLSCCSTQWIEVKCEDHLRCCRLLCFCDTSGCLSVLTYSSGRMLFPGCPTCSVKKIKFIISQRHHRPSEGISSAICALTFPPVLWDLQKQSLFKLKGVKRDQLLFTKVYKVSRSKGVTLIWSYLEGSILHSLSGQLMSKTSNAVTTSHTSASFQRAPMPLDSWGSKATITFEGLQAIWRKTEGNVG